MRVDYNSKFLKKIDLGAFQIFVTPRYVYHYTNGRYEPFSSEIIKKFLKRNSTFVDVGAHFGYYSLVAHFSKPNVRSIIIEPVKENLEIVKKNLKLNNVERVEIYGIAASDKKQVKTLNIARNSSESGFYSSLRSNTLTKRKIKAFPLDLILSGRKADFIKIDVEGHEIAVLEGLKDTIKKNRNLVLLIEFYPQLQESVGYHKWELIQALQRLEFEIFLIDEDKKTLNHIDNIEKLEGLLNEGAYANILCTRGAGRYAQMKKLIKNLWRRFYFMGVNLDRLHLGSGAVCLPGWLNIDSDLSLHPDIYPLDLSRPLPFPDNSVSMIFSEHLIEHLPKEQGLQLLKECYRVLKPKGAIRMGWPDFSKHVNAYLKKDSKYREKMTKHMGANRTGSWDEFIADVLYSWDHRYCYTTNLLSEYMKLAGFQVIKRSEFNESAYGFVWDTRDDPDTSYIESRK